MTNTERKLVITLARHVVTITREVVKSMGGMPQAEVIMRDAEDIAGALSDLEESFSDKAVEKNKAFYDAQRAPAGQLSKRAQRRKGK